MKKSKQKLAYKFVIIFLTFIAISCTKKSDPFDKELVLKDGFKGEFKDHRDGNVYQTIGIGYQVWMSENLKYNTNEGIWIDDSDTSFVNTYGHLYDWKTACKVCPKGWHLPNNNEWEELVNFLGGESIAGSKIKDTLLWNSPNYEATNSVGFSALPSGFRSLGGVNYNIGSMTGFWSSTGYDETFSNTWELRYNEKEVRNLKPNLEYGYSVRCVQDN